MTTSSEKAEGKAEDKTEQSELKSAQDKIIQLMEKAHAMEVKVKEQEIEALNIKHAAQTERAGVKMSRLAE